ncbi:MAG: class I SAM-dependent methyltransferase [Gammaproteobacteria bacterium]|nr:class I SAM-dependent methyltransferase [Gammaproteobacteria bacterium]
MFPPDPALPEPDPGARAHSQALCRRIAGEIAASGGWIGFDRYMELALYTPGLGYYAGGAAKLGASGDFVTAPEISSLFSAALARQLAELLPGAGGEVLELGAGSGRMAADLLPALDALDRMPARYSILELSSDLRQRQQQRIAVLPDRLAGRVQWLDRLPERFSGVIVGNEVLDALPVHLVVREQQGDFERGVVSRDAGFAFEDRAVAEGELAQRMSALDLPAPYLTEIGLQARGLLRSLASRLERGTLLFIDYGFGEAEYYHPQRSQGTLMCHYRHRAHADPFFLPGLQDITAHVDFSAVAGTGVQAGLNLLGYTTQAHFLINLGITELLARISPERPADYLPAAAQAQIRTLLAESLQAVVSQVLIKKKTGGRAAGRAAGVHRQAVAGPERLRRRQRCSGVALSQRVSVGPARLGASSSLDAIQQQANAQGTPTL